MTAAENIDPGARRRRTTQAGADGAARTAPGLVALFVLATCLPIFLNLGGVIFTANRLVSFIAFVPAIALLLSGRAGRLLPSDMLMIGAFVWLYPALFFNDGLGMGTIVFGGSQIVDFLGPYLLARVLIRNKADFIWMARCFTFAVLVMAPFAVFESLTDRQPLREIFDAIPGLGIVREMQRDVRMGIHRAQVTHEHPILFGLFSTMALSLAWVALPATGSSRMTSLLRTVAAGAGGFFSISAAALLAILMQGGLIAYSWVLGTTRRGWSLLAGGLAAGYVIISVISMRPPLMVLAYALTHNANTAYNRLLIWRYGSDEVLRHPIFGMGNFVDWERADWMSESVDNHWLLLAMRYGLPHILMYGGAIALLLAGMMRLRCDTRPELDAIRRAMIFTILTMVATLFTVLAWGGLNAMFMFLLGACGWILSQPQTPDPASPDAVPDSTEKPAAAPNAPVYSRFSGPPSRKADPAETPEPAPPVAEKPAPAGPERRRRPPRSRWSVQR